MTEDRIAFPERPRALRDLGTHVVLFVVASLAALGFDALDDRLNWFYYMIIVWLVILAIHTFVALGAERLIVRSDALSKIAPYRTKRQQNETATPRPPLEADAHDASPDEMVQTADEGEAGVETAESEDEERA